MALIIKMYMHAIVVPNGVWETVLQVGLQRFAQTMS